MADEKTEKSPPPMTVDEETGTTEEIDPTMAKHTKDADEALAVFEDLHGEVITLDEETGTTEEIDPTMAKHTKDADEALAVFEDLHGEVITLDEETNKRILRTIDWHIMPIMCLVYGMNFLDKTTLSYASIMGIKTDLNLVGDDYQWLGSLFYFGYLAWEYPTNRLLQRLPLGKYSAACIIIWGAILCCFAAVNNFSGAIAIRDPVID